MRHLTLRRERVDRDCRYPGPPITKEGAIEKLMSHGVTVGIGCEEIWAARNIPFDAAWVSWLALLLGPQ